MSDQDTTPQDDTQSTATDPNALTVEQSMEDFKNAYRPKAELIRKQREDFLFRLGKQWEDDTVQDLAKRKIKAVTDNRIQPNIFLITGLERQNRSDFKAFPEGEEDSLKAEVATDLFKDVIKKSDFQYKTSEAFEDGITCGESHLELYLDYTYNILNGRPCWKKIDSNQVFPEPGFKEYDFSDARYVYKLTTDLSREDLISMYPEQEAAIEALSGETGKIDVDTILNGEERSLQTKDYGPKDKNNTVPTDSRDATFDLLERYYKKWVSTAYVADYKTGEIRQAQNEENANGFVGAYQNSVAQEQAQNQFLTDQHQQATQAHQIGIQTGQIHPLTPPPTPPTLIPPQDPNRFKVIKRLVPEIWCFAHVPGMDQPLCDERAWFYPKWKQWPIIPYFAHFSTAPLQGDDRHLLIQGIVRGVKDVQEKHNKAETLKLMHLNSSANSGWLSEEGAWVDEKKVEAFGSMPGVNLEYKEGVTMPQRIEPTPLSQAHTQIASESAEAIKAILGINSDLLAAEQSGSDSGRAIALRQKQGLVMIQKLFDNLSRTKQLCGRFLLTQLGEIYDTDSAKKVLGDAFLQKNFPPPTMPVMNPQTGMNELKPQNDPQTGQPMQYDEELADATITAVLAGDLEQYDVTVGEAVASDTMRMANSAELSDLAAKMPGIIPPEILVQESQLNESTKAAVLNAIKQAQAAQAAMMQKAAQPPAGAPPGLPPAA